MTELTEQIQRYVEALEDPAAIGPDPAEALDPMPGPDARSGRRVLAACLVVLVIAASGGLVLASRHRDPSPTAAQPAVTATGGNDQLGVDIAVNESQVAYGSTLTAHITFTNRSTAPLRVARATISAQVIWDSPTATAAEIQAGQNGPLLWPIFGSGLLTDSEPYAYTAGGLEGTVVLDPGQTVSSDGTIEMDDRVRPGPALVVVTPNVFTPNPDPSSVKGDYVGPDGSYISFGPLRDAVVTIPITIGEPTDSTVTGPEAVALALNDPTVSNWEQAALPGRGSSQHLEKTGSGWKLLVGTSSSGSASIGSDEAFIRQSNDPGLIVSISQDRTVSVDYIKLPGA